MVFFINTISNGQKKMNRFRRRSVKTITNICIFRVVFGEMIIKKLDISVFIDMYNRYMNEIDNADQLRNYYITQKVYFKN